MHRHFVIASLPAALIGAYRLGSLSWLVVLTTSLLTAWLWSYVFARVRGRDIDPVWLPAGWLFALIVPSTITTSYVIAALSFGLVLGCHAFGGSGRYLVSPVLLAAVFLATGYPAALDGVALADADTSAVFPLACLAGAVYLVAVRAASPMIISGGVIGLAVTGWLTVADGFSLMSGQFAVLLAFIATDPTTRPRTPVGALTCGLMFGALTSGLQIANPSLPESSWAALLLASLCVPLFDQLVTLAQRFRGVADNA